MSFHHSALVLILVDHYLYDISFLSILCFFFLLLDTYLIGESDFCITAECIEATANAGWVGRFWDL